MGKHNTRIRPGHSQVLAGLIQIYRPVYKSLMEDSHSMRAASRVMEEECEGKWKAQTIRDLFIKLVRTPTTHHRTQGTGQNEWYTPEIHIQAARDVMGEIDKNFLFGHDISVDMDRIILTFD